MRRKDNMLAAAATAAESFVEQATDLPHCDAKGVHIRLAGGGVLLQDLGGLQRWA